MSRWAEAFRASIRRRDTVDAADTSSPDRTIGPPAPPPSVNSVSCVTGSMKDTAGRPFGNKLSAVSIVSRVAAEAEKSAARGRTALPGRVITEGYRQTTLQRPPSWADPAALPSHGCFCSCCHGRRWWREARKPERLAWLGVSSAGPSDPRCCDGGSDMMAVVPVGTASLPLSAMISVSRNRRGAMPAKGAGRVDATSHRAEVPKVSGMEIGHLASPPTLLGRLYGARHL